MLASFKSIYDYHELLMVLTGNNITLRYKQSHLGSFRWPPLPPNWWNWALAWWSWR